MDEIGVMSDVMVYRQSEWIVEGGGWLGLVTIYIIGEETPG